MRTPLVALGVAGALSAQTVVSPSSLALVEGAAGYEAPFARSPCRYQQIHGSLRGQPLLVQSVSWRRDGATGLRGATWWVEFEVAMAAGRYDRAGTDFAANVAGGHRRVFSRRRVVMPDWTRPPAVPPASFDLTLLLDEPFAHSGSDPLLWEVQVFDTSGPFAPADGFLEPVTVIARGTTRGLGCGWGILRWSLDGFVMTTTDNQFYFWYSMSPPPFGVPGLFVFGFAPANLTIPDLCVPLLVTPDVVLPAVPGNGFGIYLPYDPGMVGVVLHAQAFIQDLNRPVLPLAGSNAREITAPGYLPLGEREILRVFDGASPYPIAVERGAGLVTKFN